MYKLKSFLREIKYAWQRATRGFDDLALWNYHSWFARISCEIFKELSKNHCGHPFDLTEEEWAVTLERLSFLFSEIDEDTCSVRNEYEKDFYEILLQEYDKNREKTWARISETPDEVKENYYKRENEIFEYRNKCKDEALDLIKEYFWNLWD